MTIMVYHNRLGTVDSNVVKVDTAVSEYDERLFLDRHPENGDWVVMIRMPRPGRPYPVLGFQELPEVHVVIEKLRASDSMREDIRKNMLRYNIQKDRELDHKIAENVGAAAELVEHISRKTGKVSEYKSYRKVKPKKRTKTRK